MTLTPYISILGADRVRSVINEVFKNDSMPDIDFRKEAINWLRQHDVFYAGKETFTFQDFTDKMLHAEITRVYSNLKSEINYILKHLITE